MKNFRQSLKCGSNFKKNLNLKNILVQLKTKCKLINALKSSLTLEKVCGIQHL